MKRYCCCCTVEGELLGRLNSSNNFLERKLPCELTIGEKFLVRRAHRVVHPFGITTIDLILAHCDAGGKTSTNVDDFYIVLQTSNHNFEQVFHDLSELLSKPDIHTFFAVKNIKEFNSNHFNILVWEFSIAERIEVEKSISF